MNKVKVKNITLSKPWITKGLLKSVRKKSIILACVSSETHNLQAVFFFVHGTVEPLGTDTSLIRTPLC